MFRSSDRLGPCSTSHSVAKTARHGQACLPTKKDEHRRANTRHTISDDGLQNPGTCRDKYPEHGSTSG